MSWKPFGNDLDGYLARATKNRDFAYAYTSRRSVWQKIGDWFSGLKASIALKFKRTPSYRSTSFSSNYSNIDLSHISSEETFVIGGPRPSKIKRFLKKLKSAFKDDTPRAPAYNARNQFSIKGTRPSAYESLKTRRREMNDLVDLSSVAKTLEKGRIK